MTAQGKRVRDFVIYVAIAFAFAAGLVWYASASGPNGADLFGRWGGLAVNTAILFGYVVRDSRRQWHATTFWVIAVGMLALHLLVFALILVHVKEWKVVWFLVMYPVELPLFLFLRDKLVGIEPSTRRM